MSNSTNKDCLAACEANCAAAASAASSDEEENEEEYIRYSVKNYRDALDKQQKAGMTSQDIGNGGNWMSSRLASAASAARPDIVLRAVLSMLHINGNIEFDAKAVSEADMLNTFAWAKNGWKTGSYAGYSRHEGLSGVRLRQVQDVEEGVMAIVKKGEGVIKLKLVGEPHLVAIEQTGGRRRKSRRKSRKKRRKSRKKRRKSRKSKKTKRRRRRRRRK